MWPPAAKGLYVRKAGQGLSALVQDLALIDEGTLYKAVCSTGVMERMLAKEDNVTDTVDETMMNAQLFISLINLQNKEKRIFLLCLHESFTSMTHDCGVSSDDFSFFRSRQEFLELFSKLEKLQNFKVILI